MAPPSKLVLIGMSYCAEWNLNLQGGYQVINRGVNGDLTDGMLKRFEADVLREKPDYALIWGFSNDITTGDRQRISEIRKNIKENIDKMVGMSKDHRITPILGTQLSISYKKTFRELLFFLLGKLSGRTGYTDFANREIAALNNWLKIYAEDNQLLLLKLEEQLSNRWGFRKLRYTKKDGSHVTESGYERLSAYAGPILTEYFSKMD
jgi:lysophospholipase L1-like esterase